MVFVVFFRTIPGLSDTALVSKGFVPDASPYASSQPAPQVFNQPPAQSQPEATKAEPVNSQPSPRAAPVKHLTAAEKKRLQWEREKGLGFFIDSIYVKLFLAL